MVIKGEMKVSLNLFVFMFYVQTWYIENIITEMPKLKQSIDCFY